VDHRRVALAAAFRHVHSRRGPAPEAREAVPQAQEQAHEAQQEEVREEAHEGLQELAREVRPLRLRRNAAEVVDRALDQISARPEVFQVHQEVFREAQH
jgi:hypothetical protein